MDKIILSKGAEKFNVNLSELLLLGGYSNNIYEYRGKQHNFILKFYLPPDDNISIQSELEWILFLHQSKIKVASPMLSRNGNYIETIEMGNGESIYVVAFQKVQGTFIDTQNKNEWNPEFFNRYGKTLGKIHNLAKHYITSHHTVKRKEWNEGILFSEKPNMRDEISAKWAMYVDKLEKLPKNHHSYGLIHGDLHIHNFFVQHKELVLFDFGDCEYHWFVYDIAIVIYHAVQATDLRDEQSKTDFAHQFIQSFLKGYFAENHLSKEWLGHLPFFLNYRQLFSYMYFNKTLQNEQKNNSKVKKKLETMRNRILYDIAYIELDIEKIF